ncbi:hypothetical protein FRB90_009686, partial [Tulasnella sp. 427]
MRSSFKLFQVFCSLLFAVAASATLLFRPSTTEHRAVLESQELEAAEMTNAERFASGLPPLPPTTRTR